MCGFVAVLSPRDPRRTDRLREATGLLAHRGPDDEAFVSLPAFSAGFRRLKIVDLSDGGRQPMVDETGRYHLVFNGEIYNYIEIRNDLSRAGWSFRTKTDTEVLLKALIHWGDDCLGRLNGMFAFLAWDRRERRLFGARDRFGEKPLYHATAAGEFFFASEIKALFPLLGRVPECRPGVVRKYLQYGSSDIFSDTFYRGIHAVPAGHKFALEGGRLRIAPYWRLESGTDFRGDPIGAFRDLLRDAIRLRVRCDVPLGSCLSGGVDSGAIVCSLPRATAEAAQVTRKTFTATYPEFDEERYVALVNEYSESQGHTNSPEPRDLGDLERLLRFHDEPFHSFSAWVGYEVMRQAKGYGIVVLLNGQGADELLGGYPYSFPIYLAQLLRRGRALRAVLAARGAGSLVSQGALRTLLQGQGLLLKWALEGLRGPLRRAPGRRRRRDQALDRHCLQGHFLERAEEDPTCEYALPLGDRFKSHLASMLMGESLPLYLRVEDRNAMALSMESRLPFLDHRLAELAFSMPTEIFMRGGVSKYLLRESMAGILPDEVRLRADKNGFFVPQGRWIYGALRPQIEELLASRVGAGDEIFDAPRLRARFAADAATDNREATRFWFRVVCLLLWRNVRESMARDLRREETRRPLADLTPSTQR